MTAVMDRPIIGIFDPEAFVTRVIADCMNDALVWQWEKRSETFQKCRPTERDWPGRATPQQLAEDDRRCAATAAACRSHADLIGGIR